ncbi:ExbD/TolR family protein [Celeribacter persicus]|uniref:Outer membrane transport energization protein ExbD n=1 Tax=Celeribacter persicus TaxID=1651082 RepID=A0A2T5HTG4_9RHOB|nr:biopolymer transporter ExbD [Celeribacter persicus]PTQ74880.1 outer membrane transport energization protein ExbD [Celeribacter persicus]
MDFSDTPRPQPAETVVPMINVVFLLLIFFLMTAEIAPPDPIELELPEAGAEAEITAPLPLYLAKDGTLAFRDAQGEEAVLHALELERIDLCADGGCIGASGPSIAMSADREVPASVLAALLPKLAALGFPKVELVTRTGGGS